ncbi:DUF983 domain-containing protein [Aquirufa beregesia]
MKSKFNCPHCQKPQNLKYLLYIHKVIKWECPNCNKEITPKKLSAVASILIGISFYITCYVPLIIFKWNITNSILLGVISGLFTYFMTLVFYYFTKEIE